MCEYQGGRGRWRRVRVRLQDVGIVAVRHDMESAGDISPIPLRELSMQLGGVENNCIGSLDDLRFKPPVSAGTAWFAPWRPRPRIWKSATQRTLQSDLRAYPMRWQVNGGADESTTSIRCRRTMRSPCTDGVAEPADFIIRKAEKAGCSVTAPRPPTCLSRLCVARAVRVSDGASRRSNLVSPAHHRGQPATRAGPNDRQARIGSSTSESSCWIESR